MLGVLFARAEYGVREVGVIDAVGPLLRFQSQSLAEAYGARRILAGVTAVEEVPTVELQARLVGKNLHNTPCLRLIYAANLTQRCIRRSGGCQNPVVVVSASEDELGVILPYPLPYPVGLTEVEGSTLDAHQFACRNQEFINRSDCI